MAAKASIHSLHKGEQFGLKRKRPTDALPVLAAPGFGVYGKTRLGRGMLSPALDLGYCSIWRFAKVQLLMSAESLPFHWISQV